MRATTAEDFLKEIIVTIDGPAGSGKTTTARGVARALNFRHLDTGAMYRAVTLAALERSVATSDDAALTSLAHDIDITFTPDGVGGQRVAIDNNDVTDAIRRPDVTDAVSAVSAVPGVRQAMVRQQRALATGGGVVLEGRDTGTIVLPHAHVKIYLEAEIGVRAERRSLEYVERGVDHEPGTVRADLEVRDRKDSSRETSPLKCPVGASIVDTGALSVDEQVASVVETARATAANLAELAAHGGLMRRRKFHFAFAQTVIRWTVRLLWGTKIRKKPRYIFKENYVFASNHRSNADPPFAGSTISRNVFFVAKKSLFDNWFFGWLIKTFNAFPIRRGQFDRAAMETTLAILERGDSVLIFPEGTRQRDASKLGESKAGVGYVALQSGRPIVPIYIDGTQDLKASLRRRPRMTVYHGHPIRYTDPDLERYRTSDGYRDLGRMVMAAIATLKDEVEADRR